MHLISLVRKPPLKEVTAIAAVAGCIALFIFLLLPSPAQAAVSISQPSNLVMPAIPGTGGGTSEGSTTWTVTGTALLGYTLEVSASSTPAMVSGAYNIPDYPATTPQTWSVASDAAAFGFSAEGDDTSTSTWGTPSTGNGKYRGFAGTSKILVAQGGILSFGNPTTIYFKVQVGSAVLKPSGTYVATITATATSLL